MPRPVRLVRNIEASRLFDTFLVSSIATVLITRAYLSLAGYPQIGSSQLHIAHLLPGGLLMMTAILIMIGSINRSSRDLAAFLGGIGFGLFWDELGKFITQDNDYFFKPAVGIIYLSFVVLYLVTRYIIRRSYHSEDYLANAIDLAMDGAIGELDPREYADAKALLAKADPKHPMYKATVRLLEQAKPTKDYQPFFLDRLIARLHKPFRRLVQQPWFGKALIAVFYGYSLAIISTLLIVIVNGSWGDSVLFFLTPGARANDIAMLSSLISAAYTIWGSWFVHHRKTHEALRRYETALLINIFVTQTFLFFSYQLTATIALLFALAALFAVRVLLTETTPWQSRQHS
jgi:Ca2+/Na+ antiporter